jgi:hypothetical protein
VATAARVDAYRRLIAAASAGSGIDPNTLEGIVFLESAGRPNEIAGADPSAASGLTQILAETGSSLLGMHIDLPQSRRLTAAIARAAAVGDGTKMARLQRQRAKVDDRFDPRRALAATVRYLQLARQRLGRDDLAVVSYHMGIGNLQHVLSRYDGGHPVPYPQVYFDTGPNSHPAAYSLLSGLGDDSSRYYWRVLEAAAIMRVYRSDPRALMRLAKLETAGASTEQVLHPPRQTRSFADQDALRSAYANRALVALPSDPGRVGLTYDPGMGSGGSGPPALYRGLRPPALDLLVELGARVRALSGGRGTLTVVGTVRDRGSQGQFPDTTGDSFELSRVYSSHAQAVALQAMLDRLQALNLIAWARSTSTIQVTVADDASKVIVDGP